MGVWSECATALTGRSLTGTGAFRLIPQDPMARDEADGTVSAMAGGLATCLTYRWRHPQDGPQEGVLLIASPEEDGTVQATLVDSWHQKPGPMHLTGTREGARTRLHATYLETWGWNVEVELTADGVHLVMRNVVPEDAHPEATTGQERSHGPYDVLDLELDRSFEQMSEQ